MGACHTALTRTGIRHVQEPGRVVDIPYHAIESISVLRENNILHNDLMAVKILTNETSMDELLQSDAPPKGLVNTPYGVTLRIVGIQHPFHLQKQVEAIRYRHDW